MKHPVSYLALMAGLALATAGQAYARNITVDSLTTWSSISPAPTADDTISIVSGGSLYVDLDAVEIKTITIGDAGTSGSLLFDNVKSRRLVVREDILFGAQSGNVLNMAAGTIAHELRVSRNFLTSGSGTFNGGLGLVSYRGGNQTVTARVGGSGNLIEYKNLELAGTETKTIPAGLRVVGKLSARTGTKIAGTSAVSYGGQAALEYTGQGPITTTTAEFPSPMTVPVSVVQEGAVALVVKLDSAKSLTSSLRITGTAATGIDTDGKNLTVHGNIENQGAIFGSGTVILGGSVAQVLTGSGVYGNVTLSNAAGGARAQDSLSIGGRLNIASGKLTLTALNSTATLLTLNGTDQAGGKTYGSTASGADTKNDTYFAGSGVIAVAQKYDSSFTVTKATINYGTATVTITGQVTGGLFGNGAVDGELVTVRIQTSPIALVKNTVTTGGNGSFSVQFDTTTVPAGKYSILLDYAGGVNLQPENGFVVQEGLTINKLDITVTPDNKSKVYATADPPLTFSYAPPLAPGDGFTGSLTRQLIEDPVLGQQVGNYLIQKGTLGLTANYNLVFTEGRTLTITPKPVSVVAEAKSKTYGQADPILTYTFSPPTLPFGDVFVGGLTRDAGEDVKAYQIKQGDLRIKTTTSQGDRYDNYTINYTSANLTINRLNTIVGLVTASQKKTYGGTDPDLLPSFTPALVLGDTYTGKLARAAGEAAGSYAINFGTVKIVNGEKDKGANYNATLLDSLNFVIVPADLKIESDSKTIAYGDAIPSLIKYTGLVKDEKQPATPASVGNWKLNGTAVSAPTVGTMPGTYTFEVLETAVDPNYKITYAAKNGTLTITKRPLTVTADNKSKVEDGLVFPGPYTASYNFVAGDTVANSFTSGSITFGGAALTATAAGVHEITVTGNYASDKYTDIAYKPGSLVITKAIGTELVTGADRTWGPGQSYSWAINQANGGTAGTDPGWKLLKIAKDANNVGGNLNISATPENKFVVYLTTLTLGSPTAGNAAKFDPTRGYTWTFVQAASISGFAADKFELEWQGAGFFVNPTFGGTFSIEQWPAENPTELRLKFTPKPQSELADGDIDTLLNYLMSSDVDVMYLSPDSTSITPQGKVTVRINAANLQQNVFGAQAYIRFSSGHFVTDPKDAGAPVVAPGGGVWANVIYKMWNEGGDLDTVIGLSFGAPLGTSDDGTVALVTLTPKRTMTGKSKVVFRSDTAPLPGTAPGGTIFSASGGKVVQPGRVPTKDITIVVDDKTPVINSVAVTQNQYGVSQNVKNGPSTDPVRYTTVRGTVNITVNASDLPGTGLKAAPKVELTGPSNQKVEAKVTNPGTADGDYFYTWAVDGATEAGKWNAVVTATDMLGQSKTDTFYVTINKLEVQGIVQLDQFMNGSRMVTFTAGNGSAIKKTWQINLAFNDTKFLGAGEYSDLPAFAKELLAPSSAVETSAYLRYGTVASLSTLANRLLYGTDGMANYMRDLLFGYIDTKANFDKIVAQLKTPQRSVDAYIRGRLSAETIALINSYPSKVEDQTQAIVAALETAILDDFNTIVLGVSIYDELRFASVQPPVEDDPEIAPLLPPYAEGHPTRAELNQLNRLLLNRAYVGPDVGYRYGQLNPATAQGLLMYAGASDPALVGLILLDFDLLTQPVSEDLWGADSIYTEQRFLGIPLRKQTSDLVLKLMNDGSLPPAELVQLNRLLLEDAFVSSVGVLNYTSGALSPATAAALAAFTASPTKANQAIVEPLLSTDLNKVLTAGTYTRSALETAYPTQITKYTTRGSFTLVDVPADTTLVGAKTAWNLRETLAPVASGTDTTRGLAYYVNGGNVSPVENHYLMAGDVNGDNVIDLADFNVLQQTYGSTVDLRADLNGDAAVNILDYRIQQAAFGGVGDAGVDGK